MQGDLWDSLLPSGVYFYQVESNNEKATGKMVLVK
jgi:hypothetical protein